MRRVAILGGGVAGMSAAHELVERGFDVTVFEKKKGLAGGKARSIPVPNSGIDNRADLPGEHGFRFFPRFYRHLPDTMKRIPFGGGKSVHDNLVQTTRIEMAQYGKPPVIQISRFPRSLSDLHQMFETLYSTDVGISKEETRLFADRIWQIMTSCKERRIGEYEKTSWWTFIDADNQSEAYQKFLGHGITRSLVAAKADKASTRTIGDITVRMFTDIVEPGISADRLLNGPTNDAWIIPWLEYLRSRGVDYQMDAHVDAIHCDGREITGATITSGDRGTFDITADYYIAALPIEAFAPLLTDTMTQADPTLASIRPLSANVDWMNGIQFYVTQDAPVTHGHAIYIDSEWALTSISQHQFWTDYNMANYGDGKVGGIISVDISDWHTPGVNGKKASESTRDEIAKETWEQLKKSLNVEGADPLTDDHLHSWFLDPDILSGEGIISENLEPLLVNLVDTWDMRPEAFTALPNLFLASDYVQTNTDLATMEGANEAARRAVNGIINASGAEAHLCSIWDLHEPDILAPWRLHDKHRYAKGLPWDGKIL